MLVKNQPYREKSRDRQFRGKIVYDDANIPWEDYLQVFKVRDSHELMTSYNKVSIDDCLKAINTLYKNFNRPPTIVEYDKYAKENNLIQRRNLEIRMNKKWSVICQEVVGTSNQYEKSKEEIYNELLMIKNKIGRIPMASELKDYGFNFRQCYRAFGCTYNEMIKSFGWGFSGKKWSGKTLEQLIDDFEKLYHEIGRLPTPDDINDCEYTASYSTYQKRIGNIFEVCKLTNIGLENVIENLNISCGYVFLDKNNEICLSQPELLISNFLIENNISFQKEYSYANVIQNIDPRRRFDWYLKDFDVFIEYFGLFNEKDIGKNSRIGKYSEKVINKINICKSNNIVLISLFNQDIKSNLKGVKRKLSPYLNPS